MQKNAKKFCFYQKLYVYLQMHLGFVKIRDALVKSSLVFVLVGGYRLVAPKFILHQLMCSSLNNPDDFLYRQATVGVEPIVNAVADLNGYGRIKEVGRTNLDSRGTSHQELYRILG